MMHRSDPLDIPLIDNHLLLHLLLPRLVSSIKFTFPQIYSDWSTSLGDTATTTTHNDGSTKKRILEGLLKTCLLLGSCRHVLYNNKRQGSIRKVHVATPAMNSLGMFLRPTAALRSNSSYNGTSNRRSYGQTLTSRIIQQYGKVVALLFTTVIIPTFYQELKHHRAKQLEDRERQLRLDEIRTEFRASINVGGSAGNVSADGSNAIQGHDIEQQTAAQTTLSQQQQQRQGIIIQQRASKRKSQLITFISDTILGMSDVCIPPLRLVTYIAYLWGIGMGKSENSYIHTPFLSMQIAGWEFSSSGDGLNDNNDDDGSNMVVNNSGQQQQQQQQHQRYQRHVNYQYGNRRLLIEEALRTASMIIPPFTTAGDEGGSGGNVGTNIPVRGQPNAPLRVRSRINGRGMGRENPLVARNSNNFTGEMIQRQEPHRGMLSRMNSMAQRTVVNRNGWIRKRVLSFMGVSDADDVVSAADTHTCCSMCHVDNPSIPYIASCGHCYCYLCLRMAITDDLSFRCLDCGQLVVSSCRPQQ